MICEIFLRFETISSICSGFKAAFSCHRLVALEHKRENISHYYHNVVRTEKPPKADGGETQSGSETFMRCLHI
jgi:hypothetical protein